VTITKQPSHYVFHGAHVIPVVFAGWNVKQGAVLVDAR